MKSKNAVISPAASQSEGACAIPVTATAAAAGTPNKAEKDIPESDVEDHKKMNSPKKSNTGNVKNSKTVQHVNHNTIDEAVRQNKRERENSSDDGGSGDLNTQRNKRLATAAASVAAKSEASTDSNKDDDSSIEPPGHIALKNIKPGARIRLAPFAQSEDAAMGRVLTDPKENSFKKRGVSGYELNANAAFLQSDYSYRKMTEIPHFEGDVRRALEYAGHEFKHGAYTLPTRDGPKSFLSQMKYREFMAKNGIPLKSGVSSREAALNKAFLKAFVWAVNYRVDRLLKELQKTEPDANLWGLEGNIEAIIDSLAAKGIADKSKFNIIDSPDVRRDGIPVEWIEKCGLNKSDHILLELYVSCASQRHSCDSDMLRSFVKAHEVSLP